MHAAEIQGHVPRGFYDLFTEGWGFVLGDAVQNIMWSKCLAWAWDLMGDSGLQTPANGTFDKLSVIVSVFSK